MDHQIRRQNIKTITIIMIAITFIALSIACFSMAHVNKLDQDIQNFDKETIVDAINELEKRIIKIEQQLSNNN